MIPNLRILSGQ